MRVRGIVYLGLCIALLIAILVFALTAWMLYLVWNAMSAHHIAYWLVLVALLVLGTAAGAGVAWLEMRRMQ